MRTNHCVVVLLILSGLSSASRVVGRCYASPIVRSVEIDFVQISPRARCKDEPCRAVLRVSNRGEQVIILPALAGGDPADRVGYTPPIGAVVQSPGEIEDWVLARKLLSKKFFGDYSESHFVSYVLLEPGEEETFAVDLSTFPVGMAIAIPFNYEWELPIDPSHNPMHIVLFDRREIDTTKLPIECFTKP